MVFDPPSTLDSYVLYLRQIVEIAVALHSHHQGKCIRLMGVSAVPKDDKNVIRSRLLDSVLNEPDDRLALQNALVVAKVARFEFPQDWPDVVSNLVQTLRSASQIPPLQLARALLLSLIHI